MSRLELFTDITVMPVQKMNGHIGIGGPIWPDFYRQTRIRQCRDGWAVDARPSMPRRAPRILRRPAIWGGVIDFHFGHMVAEHLTRVLYALAERPNDAVLFATPAGMTEEQIPDYIWQMFDWFGIARRKVCLINEPRLTVELRVAPQGEMLGAEPPDPAYLDLLDDLMKARGISGPSRPIVYVTRNGMASDGRGGHLGESYLVTLLQRLGVMVVDPVAIPVRAQLEAYASAEVLIFSEGSAIHGRQLLGRIPQDIRILRRRPNVELGRAQLTPRCRRLAHDPVVGTRLMAQVAKGEMRKDRATCFYDVDALHHAFADAGLDLARHWKSKDYKTAALSDALDWMEAGEMKWGQRRRNLTILAEEADGLIDIPLPIPPKPAGDVLH